MTRLLRVLCMSILVAAMAGCSSMGGGARTDGGAAVDDQSGGNSDTSGGTQTSGLGDGGSYGSADLNDPNSALSKRIIYFDFNSSAIGDEFQEVLTAHAGYLAAHPDVRIVLEGHADERGSREYNIALGERRALSIRQVMEALGASSAQMDVVSYGEERAQADGHDERSWWQNRRVELLY